MKLSKLSLFGALLAAALLSTTAFAQSEASCSANGGTNCQGTIPDFPIATPFTSTFTAPAVRCGGVSSGFGIRVNVVHDNVGDLTVSVAGPAGNAVLLNQPTGAFPGGCAGDDIQATFVGSGGASANFCLEGGLPAVSGTVNAVSGASALSGSNSSGVWTLTVADNSNGFEGFVQDWAVVATCAAAPVPVQNPSMLLTLLLALGVIGSTMLGRLLVRRK
jgi:subtilisin-like proprotein convertase family protein